MMDGINVYMVILLLLLLLETLLNKLDMYHIHYLHLYGNYGLLIHLILLLVHLDVFLYLLLFVGTNNNKKYTFVIIIPSLYDAKHNTNGIINDIIIGTINAAYIPGLTSGIFSYSTKPFFTFDKSNKLNPYLYCDKLFIPPTIIKYLLEIIVHECLYLSSNTSFAIFHSGLLSCKFKYNVSLDTQLTLSPYLYPPCTTNSLSNNIPV